MKKDNRLIIFSLIVVFILGLLFILIGVSNKDTKKEDKENNNQIEPIIVEDNNREETKTILKKKYNFNNKKYEFVFKKISTYSKLEENQIVEKDRKTKDGYYFNYSNLLVDIKYKDKTIFKDLTIYPTIDSNKDSKIKKLANDFMSNISHFDDIKSNKKYLLYVENRSNDQGYHILNLDKGTEIFNVYSSNLDNYKYDLFKNLEEKLQVNLSKYFKNNRKQVMLNNNQIGFIYLDVFNKELKYVEIRIRYGLIDANQDIIKSNLNDSEINTKYIEVSSSVIE